MARVSGLPVVRRRLPVHALGLRPGRALAIAGVEVHPRRDPHDRPHARRAHPVDHALRVGKLVGVEAPGVVLRLPGRVDHHGVQRQRVALVALEVVGHVVLVLVDVSALPVPVAPLRQQRREPRQPQVAAQAGRRCRVADHVQAKLPRRRAGGDRHSVSEVELRAVPFRLEPERIAAAGEQPRGRGVVAHGNPADLEHVGRALRARVAAVGPEPHPAAGLVELLPVAGAEAGEALLGPRLPFDAQPEWLGVCTGSDQDPSVLQRHRHEYRALAAERAAELDPTRNFAEHLGPGEVGDPVDLLVGEHSLGHLDELVARRAVGRPQPEAANQPALAAADANRERIERERRSQRPILEHELAALLRQGVGHATLIRRSAAMAGCDRVKSAIRGTRSGRPRDPTPGRAPRSSHGSSGPPPRAPGRP